MRTAQRHGQTNHFENVAEADSHGHSIQPSLAMGLSESPEEVVARSDCLLSIACEPDASAVAGLGPRSFHLYDILTLGPPKSGGTRARRWPWGAPERVIGVRSSPFVISRSARQGTEDDPDR